MSLLAPLLPAEIERRERERVERRKPWLAFSRPREDPRPDPDMFTWHEVGELIGRGGGKP